MPEGWIKKAAGRLLLDGFGRLGLRHAGKIGGYIGVIVVLFICNYMRNKLL